MVGDLIIRAGKKQKIIRPLSYDLAKCVRNLKYEEKVAFIDRFQLDFSDIVKSYAGEKAKIFVFIDDLDRCEVPKAAELLQAINLLLSTDQGNLFFVLGLDREMVAAGIAAKNEKILPTLPPVVCIVRTKQIFVKLGSTMATRSWRNLFKFHSECRALRKMRSMD